MTAMARPALGALLLLGTLALGAAPALAQATAPQETVKDTIGAWQIRCVQDGKVCVMAQAGKGKEGNDVIEIRIRRLSGVKAPDGTEVAAAIQVAAPLGVLLPAGLRMQVDEKKPRGAPFEVCGPSGCVVRQPMTKDFLDELRNGKEAKVTILAVPQTEVVVPISLSGFTKAYNSLEP